MRAHGGMVCYSRSGGEVGGCEGEVMAGEFMEGAGPDGWFGVF